MKARGQPLGTLGSGAEALVMALPNGRILGEVMPLLHRIGITPEPAFADPASRQLRAPIVTASSASTGVSGAAHRHGASA